MNTRTALACLLLVAAPIRAYDWPEVPVPDEATGEWVSRHMLYNGLNMRASRFEVALPQAEVERFYRARWGRLMVRTPRANTTILGHAEGRHFVTVELTASGARTRGQIGVMELPRGPRIRPLGEGFAMPSRTRVNDDIVYLDTPERTRTLNMSNALSPYQNTKFYERAMAARGYAPQPGSTPCVAASSRCIAFYAKGPDHVMVAAERARQGSSLVAVQSR